MIDSTLGAIHVFLDAALAGIDTFVFAVARPLRRRKDWTRRTLMSRSNA
jgi:hypothetical protein